jgi:hypothetical protein
MALPRPFSKEVFIRLEGNGAFVSTVKYGCFYSKTKEFCVHCDPSLLTFQSSARLQPKYLIPSDHHYGEKARWWIIPR